MKTLLVILALLLAASAASAQQIIMVPGPHGQMYPAYVDPQYGIDGRQLVPPPQPQPITVYDAIVPEGRSQRAYRLDPVTPLQWMSTPLVVGDD